jgi:hypothetical protein
MTPQRVATRPFHIFEMGMLTVVVKIIDVSRWEKEHK